MGYVKFGAWFFVSHFSRNASWLEAEWDRCQASTLRSTPPPKARGVTENQHAKSACERWHAAGSTRALCTQSPPSLLRAFPHQFVSSDITEGRRTAGEDPVVRQAAIDALATETEPWVGSEPTSGSVLAMVNQKARTFGRRQRARHQTFLALRTERRRDRLGTEFRSVVAAHESYGGAGDSNNAYFEAVRAQAGLRKGSILRAPVRTLVNSLVTISGEQ